MKKLRSVAFVIFVLACVLITLNIMLLAFDEIMGFRGSLPKDFDRNLLFAHNLAAGIIGMVFGACLHQILKNIDG